MDVHMLEDGIKMKKILAFLVFHHKNKYVPISEVLSFLQLLKIVYPE